MDWELAIPKFYIAPPPNTVGHTQIKRLLKNVLVDKKRSKKNYHFTQVKLIPKKIAGGIFFVLFVIYNRGNTRSSVVKMIALKSSPSPCITVITFNKEPNAGERYFVDFQTRPKLKPTLTHLVQVELVLILLRFF